MKNAAASNPVEVADVADSAARMRQIYARILAMLDEVGLRGVSLFAIDDSDTILLCGTSRPDDATAARLCLSVERMLKEQCAKAGGTVLDLRKLEQNPTKG